MKCILLIFVFSQFTNTYCQRGWVDPYDMNPQSGGPINQAELAIRNNNCNCEQTPDNSIHLYYLKRLTSLLLHSATLDKSDALHYHGHILFTSDKENYEFLRQFGNEQNPSENILRKLDAVFSESLGKSIDNAYIEVFLDFHNKLYYAIFSVQTLGLLGVCVLLYIVYQLFKRNFSLRYVFGYLFTIMLMVDFYLRYLELEKEAIEHNAKLTYSALCDTDNMKWYEYIQFLTSSRDCERKVVTPLSVFLFQCKSLIIVPLHALGTGMGGFGKEMFINLPWGLNLVMWPVMMLCCCIMAIFFMSFMTDQPIEFNFFYMVKMKFGKSNGFQMDSLLSGRAVERLIDTVCNQLHQLAAVQNVEPQILNDRAPIQNHRERIQDIREPIENDREATQNEPIHNMIEPNQNVTQQIQEITEPITTTTEPIESTASKNEEKSNQEEPQSTIMAASESTKIVDDSSENSDHISEENSNKSHFLEEIEKILDK